MVLFVGWRPRAILFAPDSLKTPMPFKKLILHLTRRCIRGLLNHL
jgi:hypothetical protein